jgi:homopolymeric O-antigen transport system permease protein
MAAADELTPASAAAYPGERATVIQRSRGWSAPDVRELWEYRELLYFLVWRDVKIRYKQTAIGAAWVLVQPLATAAVFTVVFGRYAKLPSGGAPYAVMVYSAVLPWLVFANALTFSTRSIVEHQALVTKVYVPRLFLPLGAVLAGLVDFAIGSVLLVVLMAWYGIAPGVQILLYPLLVVFLVATAAGVTLWLSALNVRYRDVQYTVPFLTQFLMFATPVAYSVLIFPTWLQTWIGLNPMAGVVQGFRWAVVGGDAGPVWPLIGISLVVTLVLLVGGIEYFRRVERSFADVV